MPRYPKKTDAQRLAAKERCAKRRKKKNDKKGAIITTLETRKSNKPKPLTVPMLAFLEGVWVAPDFALAPGSESTRKQLIKRGLLEKYEVEIIRNVDEITKNGKITVTKKYLETRFCLTEIGEDLIDHRQETQSIGRIKIPEEVSTKKQKELKRAKIIAAQKKAAEDEKEKNKAEQRKNKTSDFRTNKA